MKRKKKGKKNKKRPLWKKVLRIVGKALLILFILFIVLVIFIRSPWGQSIIVDKVTHYVSDKTHTKVNIDRLFITFSGGINLDGLYLEDKKGDTLIYSKSLEADIPLWPLISGNGVGINQLDWTELRANVYQKDTINGFNYQFLIDAFASEDTTSTAKPEDENSKPLSLSVGEVNFNDFKIDYDDNVAGTHAHLKLGKFYFEGKKIDLDKMKFHIDELTLSNTQVNYRQEKPVVSEDTTSTTLPYLIADRLHLENIKIDYEDLPQKISAKVNLPNFLLKLPKADLPNQEIEVKELQLNQSDIALKMGNTEEKPSVAKDKVKKQTAPEKFPWPEWNVNAENIALNDNKIIFQQGETTPEVGKFNPQALSLDSLTLKADKLQLRKDQTAEAEIEAFRFQEISGFRLRALAFSADLTPQEIKIENLNIRTNRSSLNGTLDAKFNSLQNLMDNPERTQISVQIPSLKISVKDAYVFSPELKKQEMVQKFGQKNLTGTISANGTLAKIHIPKFNLFWGGNTQLQVNGTVYNTIETEKLRLNFPQILAKTTRKDLTTFLDEEEMGISIPEQITLQSQFSGGMEDFKTDTQLIFPEGELMLKGSFKNQQQIAFDADFQAKQFDLGKILKNPKIGKLTFELKSEGKGKSLDSLDATLSSNFTALTYNDYDFSNLKLSGDINHGEGAVKAAFKDDNLNLALDSQIKLDSINPEINLDANLKGADLYALGITHKKIRAKLDVNAFFKGNADAFTAKAKLRDGMAVYDDNPYYLGDMDINSEITKDSTAVSVSSSFLNVKLRSNADPARFTTALQQHVQHYFNDSIAHGTPKDTLTKPVSLKADLFFTPTPILSNVFLEGLKEMDTLTMQLAFDQAKNEFSTQLNLPFVNYDENKLQALDLTVDSEKEKADFKLSFNKVEAGPLVIGRTAFEGNLSEGKLQLNFNAYQGEEEIYHVQSELSGKDDALYFHINPKDLILNKTTWQIPEDNRISLAPKKLDFRNFELSNGVQSLKLNANMPEVQKEHIGVLFKKFDLATIFGYFNPDDDLVSGDLSGNLAVINPFSATGLQADLTINNFKAIQAPLGKLTLNANSAGGKKYDFYLGLHGDQIDLGLKGDYLAATEGASLNLNLNLDKVKLALIEKFSDKALKNSEGSLSGEVKLNGQLTDLQYQGFLQFNQAAFDVAMFNSRFKISNEKINIDNSGISFDQFSIADAQGNDFNLNGSIETDDITNPKFDLTLDAKDFQLLNSTEKDNEVFYGKLSFDVDAKIGGNMNFPTIDGDLKVNKDTDFTYVVKASQVSVNERDGVVEFVNKNNPDAILTKKNKKEAAAIFTGMEVNAHIKTDKKAVFNVVLDERTGDNIGLSGDADLLFNIARNGRTSLTGRYEISDGHYEVNLYNLVKRRFDLAPESTITWHGDLMAADLDVKAIYKVETSASGLMASVASNESEETKQKYRQELPFLVYLNVGGEITQPKLSFNLDMPEDKQGAIGGAVYSRIRQLDQRQDELNKQVFSLLVLNRFFPNGGSDGSQGGAASIARDNLNQALSDQLNNFSGKILGNTGIDLNFGLKSYTDFQGENPENRTDLNISAQKKLFNDRVVVKAGSDVNVEGSDRPGETNPLIGNASIAYLLTKDGRWRLKGFRKNEYENIIDGQVIVSGIAVIFTREFNKFKELFRKEITTEAKKEDSKTSDAEKEKKTAKREDNDE